MKWSLAMALAAVALAMGSHTALAQAGPVQCAAFTGLKADAEQKAMAIRNAGQHHAERKEICVLVQRFTVAEAAVVKFLEANKTWCGVPEEAIKAAKANHEKTLQFRTAACNEAATRPRQPTLSDSIGTLSVDTAGNTTTGRGTLDSLTGNPLAK